MGGWGGLLCTLQDELLICGAVTDLFSYLKVIVSGRQYILYRRHSH